MTGEKNMFSSYEKNQDPQRDITFGDRNQGLVKGLGKIVISPHHSISNFFVVDSLDYNLLLFLNYAKWVTTVFLQILVLLSLEEAMIQ
jgi:hypothetical protein